MALTSSCNGPLRSGWDRAWRGGGAAVGGGAAGMVTRPTASVSVAGRSLARCRSLAAGVEELVGRPVPLHRGPVHGDGLILPGEVLAECAGERLLRDGGHAVLDLGAVGRAGILDRTREEPGGVEGLGRVVQRVLVVLGLVGLHEVLARRDVLLAVEVD